MEIEQYHQQEGRCEKVALTGSCISQSVPGCMGIWLAFSSEQDWYSSESEDKELEDSSPSSSSTSKLEQSVTESLPDSPADPISSFPTGDTVVLDLSAESPNWIVSFPSGELRSFALCEKMVFLRSSAHCPTRRDERNSFAGLVALTVLLFCLCLLSFFLKSIPTLCRNFSSASSVVFVSFKRKCRLHFSRSSFLIFFGCDRRKRTMPTGQIFNWTNRSNLWTNSFT